MSIDKRIFDGIVSDVEGVVPARVKRSLKALIKDRKEKGQAIKVGDDLKTLRDHYLRQVSVAFDEIEAEAFTAGVMKYSGYTEIKDEDE